MRWLLIVLTVDLVCVAAVVALIAQAARRDRLVAELDAVPDRIPRQRPQLDETDLLRAYLVVHKVAVECAGQQLADEAEQYANGETR